MKKRLAVGMAIAFILLTHMTHLGEAAGQDPRPSADAPFGVEPAPAPRMSRRAQRRTSRRRPLPPEESAGERAAQAGGPITVETTLASPFAELETISQGGFVVHRDQPYGDASLSRQRFDIYLPKGCGGMLPLVIWIHGETWRAGSKADCPVTWLVDAGYAVASIGYRLSDTATFPAQLDDCLAAIAAIERNAETWGVDRERICVAGTGAGGHLAALAGLLDQAPPDCPLPHVAAICVIGAPSHLPTLGPEHDRATSPASLLVGGPLPEFREVAQQASPLTHVSSDDPPVLVVHGRNDATVPPDQSARLDAALRAAGVKSSLVLVDGAAQRLPLDRSSPAGGALLEFLDRTLGAGIRPEPSSAAP